MGHFSVDDARDLFVGENFQLKTVDPASTPNFSGDEDDCAKEIAEIAEELADLQERMYAHARSDNPNTPSILLVLQGMDTAGKGGIIRHVIGEVDPQGVQLESFGVPTEEEKHHDFLWRVEKKLPGPGLIGVFDRSHYEDVLVQRVHQMAPADEIERRYGAIVDFENELLETKNIHIIKVMLHISKQFQYENLMERLDREDKYWKFNPGDIDERQLWDEYQEAYEIALQRTSTEQAPWYCIPGDNKPYARMAVAYLLLGVLRDLDLEWPAADFDVAEQQARLKAAR